MAIKCEYCLIIIKTSILIRITWLVILIRCHYMLLQIPCQKLAEKRDGKIAAAGIVMQLVVANPAQGEIAGLGMGEHKAADAGMGAHGTAFREADADLRHVKKVVEEEVQTGVGQGGIADGGTDALKLLCQHLGDGKIFIGGISPICLAHLFVHPLCGSLCQAVC